MFNEVNLLFRIFIFLRHLIFFANQHFRMINKGIFYAPSGMKSVKESNMPSSDFAGKSAFSILFLILFTAIVKCILPGCSVGSGASFAVRTASATAFEKSDLENNPGAYLLSEALPRGRILMIKILRPPAGSIYIAKYNPFFNRQILHT